MDFARGTNKKELGNDPELRAPFGRIGTAPASVTCLTTVPVVIRYSPAAVLASSTQIRSTPWTRCMTNPQLETGVCFSTLMARNKA